MLSCVGFFCLFSNGKTSSSCRFLIIRKSETYKELNKNKGRKLEMLELLDEILEKEGLEEKEREKDLYRKRRREEERKKETRRYRENSKKLKERGKKSKRLTELGSY